MTPAMTVQVSRGAAAARRRPTRTRLGLQSAPGLDDSDSIFHEFPISETATVTFYRYGSKVVPTWLALPARGQPVLLTAHEPGAGPRRSGR